jgi:hypothetical protein
MELVPVPKHHAIKTVWGSRIKALRIINLGTNGVCGQLHSQAV